MKKKTKTFHSVNLLKHWTSNVIKLWQRQATFFHNRGVLLWNCSALVTLISALIRNTRNVYYLKRVKTIWMKNSSDADQTDEYAVSSQVWLYCFDSSNTILHQRAKNIFLSTYYWNWVPTALFLEDQTFDCWTLFHPPLINCDKLKYLFGALMNHSNMKKQQQQKKPLYLLLQS